MKSPERHWDAVYLQKKPDEVSWFQPLPLLSLELIREVLPDPSGRVVDVGGGASTLVDELLRLGYRDITVVDIASSALDLVRQRLGAAGSGVSLVTSDLLEYQPSGLFDLWHDRAVLHFLTDEVQQRTYAKVLREAVRPGGHAVIATFAVGGPTRCSGLDIVQYDSRAMHALVGDHFELLRVLDEAHLTPSGSEQLFSYFLLKRTNTE